MKIGIFTDSHYSSAEITCGRRYNSKSLAKIKKAFEYFNGEGCDFVICLGDLIDREDEHKKATDNLMKVSEVINNSDIKTYVIMGNHDAFEFESDEFYSILGEDCRPENIYKDNKNIIFIDACYFKNGTHYRPGDSDWTDTFYPETDLLEKTLDKVSGNTYVFMHQNISPSIRADHRLYNDGYIREILERSNKVSMVIQGHFHEGEESVHNGIKYKTYPAMCENEEYSFIIEI